MDWSEEKVPMMTLKEAAEVLGCSYQGDGSIGIYGVANDSRQNLSGKMYAALKGTRYDGAAYAGMALENGASCIMACEGSKIPEGTPTLWVSDTRDALCTLSKMWRTKVNPWVIAIIGSNGKTTITQMIGAQFDACSPRDSMCTKGNFNNTVGLPLTLLSMDRACTRAAVEMGSSHPGEIAELSAIATPASVVVSNSGGEHVEKFGSVFDSAKENGDAILRLPLDGVVVLPKASEHFEYWKSLAGGRKVLSFGVRCGADIDARAVQEGSGWRVDVSTPEGEVSFCLGVCGLHNVENAMAALAAALCSGLPLEGCAKALEAFEPQGGRGKRCDLVVGDDRIALVDETYNCNPASAKACTAMLASLPGRKWMVLGEMRSGGESSASFMVEAACEAKAMGLSDFWAVGPGAQEAKAAFGAGGMAFENQDEAWRFIQDEGLPKVDVAAFKASRFVHMEILLSKVKSLGRCSEK